MISNIFNIVIAICLLITTSVCSAEEYVNVGEDCVDMPDWYDWMGQPCSWYEKYDKCHENGQTKNAKGVSANEACCHCGKQAPQEDIVPPPSSAPNQECKDTDTTVKFPVKLTNGNKGDKPCQWVGNKSTVNRCYKNVSARLNCKSTCRTCGCEDSSKSFTVNGTNDKNCEWVRKKWKKRCKKIDDARQNCPLTCNNCPHYPGRF